MFALLPLSLFYCPGVFFISPPQEAENLLAEAGLLAAVVDFNTDIVAGGKASSVEGGEALARKEQGVQGVQRGDQVGAEAEGPGTGHGGEVVARQRVRRLFASQQQRLSVVEMGVYDRFRSEAEELDEDFTGNFS